MSQGFTREGLTTIGTGKTLWVDSVYGNDTSALPQRMDKPYLTLTAAKTAATAGDLIYVRPGAYTPTTPISKNGVSWFFEPGASVTMDTDSDGAIFDDRSEAQSFIISGSGRFVRGETVQAEDFANVVHLSNASSSVSMWCDTILNTADQESVNEGSPGTSAIYHVGGSLTVNASRIEAQSYPYYWKVGPGWINGDVILSNGNASGDGDGILCRPPAANADNVFVRAHSITSAQKSAVYSSLADSSAPDFRLWVTAEVIAGGTVGVQSAAGKVYITAQKISAALDGSAVVKANGPTGTELYVNAQKIASADSLTSATVFTLVEASEMKVRITCMEYDVSSIGTWSATNGLFNISSGGDPLDFECTGGTIVVPSAITTSVINNSSTAAGGRRIFRGMRIVSDGPDAPVALADDATVLQDCVIVTGASSSISAASPQAVCCYGCYADTAQDSNTTVNGDLTIASYVQ